MTDAAGDEFAAADDTELDEDHGPDIPLTEDDVVDVTEPIAVTTEDELTEVISHLEAVTAQRDEYLDMARRVQAEFENYKRRVDGQRIEQVQRAAEALVVELLPVLDACEAAEAHGHDDVAPIHATLLNTLHKRGLTKVDDVGVTFDPSVHEAVLTEPRIDGEDVEGPVVSEVMRTGYSWNGRVVRPAMVKVRG